VLALSRSLVICALRLGVTGSGGGGILGASREMRARCRALSSVNSVVMVLCWVVV